jgi:predicted aspartyl protease
MIALSFDKELSYGDTHVVSVPIRVENLPYLIDAILDTGAAVSMFNPALLPDLGITDVTRGTEIYLTAADGQQGKAYLHSLQIEILGRRLSIDAAFCPDWQQGKKNLLGMRSFFEQILIAFEHQKRKFYYTVPASPTSPATGLVPPV